jgi:hypothetical protein
MVMVYLRAYQDHLERPQVVVTVITAGDKGIAIAAAA